MSSNLRRRGAAILAAASVVAGGLTVGAGSAAGAGCLADADGKCVNLTHWWAEATVADFAVTHRGPKDVYQGEKVTFYSTIDNSGDPDRGITKVVHHPPAGFVLKSVSSHRYRYVPAENRTYTEAVDLTSEVDPVTGAVILQAPPEQPVSVGDGLSVDVTYQVGQVFTAGTSGVTFEATGVPETRDWLATGTTTVAPIGGAFGSSGS